MPMINTPSRYGYVNIGLHWVMALLIVGMLILGLYMSDLPVSLEKLSLFGWHKSFGILILMLVIIRILWRFVNITPAYADNIPGWQKLAAHGMHYALYGFMFLMPLTGWLMSSAAGVTVSFFGLFTLPNLVQANPTLQGYLFQVHSTSAFVLIGLICLHVLAALKHHFWDKDDILKRMLP